jgi:hypothetical protein
MLETRNDGKSSDTDHAASFIVERQEVAAPPSIALDGIQRFLDVRNRRLVVSVLSKGFEISSAAAITCIVPVRFCAHPNDGLVTRFNDRLEIEWNVDETDCPSVSGRLTIQPLGTKTELIFKARYCWPSRTSRVVECRTGDDDTVRAIMRCMLGQFKDGLETQFEAFKAFTNLERQMRLQTHVSCMSC